MAIPINEYVNITSSVGAGAGVPVRNLGGRFFTENPLVPTDTDLEFTSLADVGTYFGTTSTEYKRASFYFGWISKSNSAPDIISFTRWANVAVGSTIYGKVATYTTSQFNSVSTGDITLTLGGFTHHLTGIDFTAAGSLTAVAADVQTAIRAYSAGGTAWTAATVTYDASRKSFDLVSGTTGDDVIAVTAGVITDIASLLGWLTGAILSNGEGAQTITEVLTDSAARSNNFGSYTFIPSLTIDQVTESAQWNNAQNVEFIYSVPVSVANASAWSAALITIGGTTMTLAPLSTEYPEQVPMMIFAATNYLGVNTSQNFMFQQFVLTPSVTTLADKTLYDELSINYYGQTQNAGALVSFYQNGIMFGLPVDPLDQNTFANEIWLKSASTSAIVTLLLVLAQLPANKAGVAILSSTLQKIINQAITNGTISVGKTLTDAQQAYITTVTGQINAWQQVQNAGYWFTVSLQTYVVSGVTKYKAVYTLLYSKDDVIRFVQGADVLI